MPPSKNISFEELSKYFHLPINQVAKEMGVCATILKKICRKNGIPRWPHRKIQSLDKMIANLSSNVAKTPQEQEEIDREIQLLQAKKMEIMKHPDILVKPHGSVENQIFRFNLLEESMKFTKPNVHQKYSNVAKNQTSCIETKMESSIIQNHEIEPSILLKLSQPISSSTLKKSNNYVENILNTSTFIHSIPQTTSNISLSEINWSIQLPAFKYPESPKKNYTLTCLEPEINYYLTKTFPENHLTNISLKNNNEFRAFPEWFDEERKKFSTS